MHDGRSGVGSYPWDAAVARYNEIKTEHPWPATKRADRGNYNYFNLRVGWGAFRSLPAWLC